MKQESLENLLDREESEGYSTLPSGWRWVKLGEVCKFEYGSGLPERDRADGAIPVFGSNGVVGYHSVAITQGRTIIIGRKGSIGQVNFSESSCWPIDTTYYIDSSKTNCDIIWLYWLLKNLKLEELNKATGVPGLNREDAYNQAIPLPPLPEQKRIAAKIQELMQEIYNLKSAISNQLEAAKALPSAYLREVFESEEAKKWERRRLREVCEIVTGSTPRTDDPTNWNGEILWATPNDMGKLAGFTIDDTERKISKKGFDSCSTKLLPPDSVLLTTRAPIGHLAINTKPICTNQGFKSLIPSSDIHNWFLFFALKYFVPVLQSMGRGQTFTEVSKGQVDNFEIPFPPLAEQHRIATELKEKMAQVENLQSTIYNQQSAIDALPQAILRKAFEGEL